MLRRSFLGALLGLAATPVLARLLPPSITVPGFVGVESPILLPTLECPVGVLGALMEFRADLPEEISPPQAMRVLRADGAVGMQFFVQRGGYLAYVAPHGAELCFTPNQPLVLDLPERMNFEMVYRLGDRYRARRVVDRQVVYDLPLQATP